MMHKFEMGRTDGGTDVFGEFDLSCHDGQSETNIPPNNFIVKGV